MMRGGGVYQPSLACPNGVVDGKKSISEQISPGHPGVASLGVVCPKTMPDTGSRGPASAKHMVPVLRRCCFMAGFCENSAKVPARTASSASKDGEDGVFLTNVPARTAFSRTPSKNSVVEITHASTNALVRARVWREHNVLLGAAVLEKTSFLRHHKLLHAGIRHVVHDNDGDHCEKQEGGCQNSTTSSVYYSSIRSDRRCRAVGEYLGGRQYTTLRTLGPWCTRRVRSHLAWWHHRSQVKNGQKVLLLRPMVSVVGQGGQGALTPSCLTRGAILPHLAGI